MTTLSGDCMTTYRRLKDCREDRDLTQKQVGDLLNIDQRVYSTYETGKRQIPHLLIALAKYYGTSLDYLADVTDEPKPYPRKSK